MTAANRRAQQPGQAADPLNLLPPRSRHGESPGRCLVLSRHRTAAHDGVPASVSEPAPGRRANRLAPGVLTPRR